MSIPRGWLAGFILAMGWMASGCSRAESDAALRVVVQVSSELKAACVQLTVLYDGGEKLSDPLPRADDGTVLFAVYRGKTFPEQVRLVAKGYLAPGGDCKGQLVLNDESATTSAQFDAGEVSEVVLKLVGANDQDGDGFRAKSAGGSDCDDLDSRVHPGAKEDCADQKDNDCNGKTDCLDPVCPNRACATGTCQGQICVNGPVELNCVNNLDDDGDNLIDCEDPNCEARACNLGACKVGTCEGRVCTNAAPKVCDQPPECTVGVGTCSESANGCVYTARAGRPACNSGNGICSDAGVCQPLFPYTPSNLPALKYSDFSEKVVVSCSGQSIFSSSDADLNSNGGFVKWCGTKPTVKKVNLPQGPVVVLAMKGLEVRSELRIVGDVPVILAVVGDVELYSTVDAGGNLESGPGGGFSSICNAGEKGSGVSGSAAGGGGGGGFTTIGGMGGSGRAGFPGGQGGSGAASAAPIESVRGGCHGGAGGDTAFIGPGGQPQILAAGGRGGYAGGGLQISTSGTLRLISTQAVTAVLTVSGGAGLGGRVITDRFGSGGGGGGSGGQLLLEADDVQIDGRITANGGGGGEGADGQLAGNDGLRAFGGDVAEPLGGTGGSSAGGDGGRGGTRNSYGNGNDGAGNGGAGGGGGGAAGKISFRVLKGCNATKVAGMVSPRPAVGCTVD